MEKNTRYSCPPRLRKGLRIVLWPAGLFIAGMVLCMACIMIRQYQILALVAAGGIVTAELDDEGSSIARWFKLRLGFMLNGRAYRQGIERGGRETKKSQRREMRKELPIQRLIHFAIEDDKVRRIRPDGKVEYCTFFHFFPPNWNIMTEGERDEEIRHYAKLLNTLQCEVCFVESDQLIDLSATTQYWSSRPAEYDYITSYIVRNIEGTNVDSCNIQRCVYIILKSTDPNQRFMQTLLSGGYQMEQLKGNDIATLLRCYYVREFVGLDLYTLADEIDKYPGMQKASRAVRDKVLQSKICPNRLDFSVKDYGDGQTLRRVISIKTFPRAIQAGLLMSVAGRTNSTFTMRLTPMSGSEVRRLVDNQSKNKAVELGSPSASRQVDAADDVADLQRFYSTLSHEKEMVWLVNIYIEFYGKNRAELDEIHNQIREDLSRNNVFADPLVHEQKEGFLSVQPLGEDKRIELANNMPSRTVAALYPWSYSAHIDPHGFPLGRTKEGGPMIIDPTQRTAEISNGNFCVFGATGKGKSWLTKKLLTYYQLVAGNTGHRYIIDPDNEYEEICRNLGGIFFDCTKGDFIINPLEIRRIATEEDDEEELAALPKLGGKQRVTGGTPAYYQHLSWLESQFQIMYEEKLTSFELACLQIMVQGLYEAFHITDQTDLEQLGPDDYPTLEDLYQFIEAKSKGGGYRHVERAVMEHILVGIHDSVYGSMAPLFCGHTNVPDGNCIVFGTRLLLTGSSQRVNAVMNNLFSYVQNEVFKREGITLLLIDELLSFVQNPIVCRYVTSGYQRFRKYNAYIGASCQQFGPLLNNHSEELSTIADNSAFKFIFNVGTCDMDRLGEALKLTEGEKLCIAGAPNHWALAVCGKSPYFFEVGCLPYEKELFGQGGGR